MERVNKTMRLRAWNDKLSLLFDTSHDQSILDVSTNNGAMANKQCSKWPWTMVWCPMNHACVFDLTYIEFLCINQPYPQYGMIHPVELGCLFSRNHLWSLIYQIHGLIVIYWYWEYGFGASQKDSFCISTWMETHILSIRRYPARISERHDI